MIFKSINPYNNEVVYEFSSHNTQSIRATLDNAERGFSTWKKTSVSHRSKVLTKVSDLLKERIESYAEIITREMGKTISESRAEVLKCAWVCEYYSEHASGMLMDKVIKTDANQSYVRYEPIGCVLAIMPWNFPFWQVFRFAAPAVMAGNVGLLKHAPNVFKCAEAIEKLFIDAGAHDGVFQSLYVDVGQVKDLIQSDVVKAVTLTGSELAGASVASIAGAQIKKTVLELGGNNPFIVLDDADIKKACEIGWLARMQNAGQSCIAAKRFIIADRIAQDFIDQYHQISQSVVLGDPMNEKTTMGPLARRDLAEKVNSQVKKTVDKGAEILIGGQLNDCFYTPTILLNVASEMPAFDEEVFGPVAAITIVSSEKEAIEVANRSVYGLGASIFTKDIDRARSMVSKIDSSAVFINEMVKSDPRLPFGGIKKSGYGRELSSDGMYEFLNAKTIYVN